MPRKKQTYVHRVGRTARAGCGGRSVTLAGEDRRALMKEIIKDNQESEVSVKARTVPASVVRLRSAAGCCSSTLAGKDGSNRLRGSRWPSIGGKSTTSFEKRRPSEVYGSRRWKPTKSRISLRTRWATRRFLRRGQRAYDGLLEQDEIAARPQKTWFQSERQKRELKKLSKAAADGERESSKKLKSASDEVRV
eukprot:scaffold517_cov255-Pinguiococcus_pyrenoidosus.AAC.28